MPPKFKAYHGQQEIKEKYIKRLKAHMEADDLRQGTDSIGGKGSVVGCTIPDAFHFAYEEELGIPFTIAILEDNIFEVLSKEASKTFPLEFLEAVPVGADLSMVYNKMELWQLIDSEYGLINEMKTDEEKKSAIDLAALHQNVIDGIEVTDKQWKAVAYRAIQVCQAVAIVNSKWTPQAQILYLATRSFYAARAAYTDPINRAFLADRLSINTRANIDYIAKSAKAPHSNAMREKFIEHIKASPINKD